MTNTNCRFRVGPFFLLAITFLVSCAQVPPTTDNHRRFHEDAATDVVLHHYRWEHINLTRPEYREDGYLVTLSRDSLGSALDRLQAKRNLAVVVFGWYYSQEQLDQLTGQWTALLRQQGFKRVVCVQGSGDKSVDGLLIIDDTKPSDDTPKQTASR